MLFKKDTPLEQQDVMMFFESLMEASHVSLLFAEKVFLQKSGLSMIQFGILKQLHKKGGSVETMTDLWCEQHTTRGNLSGVINRMIESGLVSRIEDTGDRRKKQIALTSLGKETFTSIESAMQKHIPMFLEKIADIPLRDITSSLQKITNLHLTTLRLYE